MRSKALRTLLLAGMIVVLVSGAFSAGLLVGWAVPVKLPISFNLPLTGLSGLADGNSTGATPADLADTFAPFWQAWDLVHEEYVDQPVDDEVLTQGAIRGMLDALGDPHTSYMDPEQYRQANTSLQGDYEGIGAYVDATGELLTIVSPMPGSPAEKAGLKAGDEILKVDGEDVTGLAANAVLQRVLGPAGSKVVLTLRREGQAQPFDVEVQRASISVPSVEGKLLDGNIAYVRLNTFGDNTTGELRSTLAELLANKPAGMVLDLRYNGGGYLNTAVEVASEFIGQGVILYEKYGDGHTQTYSASQGGLATEIPLVVLVNEGTASASEIVAGAIQDYGRGKLVGATTYGKGSVQNWNPLDNNEGAVRITIARWLTPNERTIHGTGLEPDVTVQLTDADAQAGIDPQLDRAVQLLSDN